VRSVEPERLTAEVLTLIECRDAMELRLTLGLRFGPTVNRGTLTTAIIDP